MNYLKNLLSSLKIIIIIYIIQYLVIFIFSFIYLLLGNDNLSNFINNYVSIILVFIYIIFILILLKKYKYKNTLLPTNQYYPLLYLGISISCLLNMLIFLLTKTTPKEITIPLYLSIISSGIIGPILEEILFRYILLNNLKKFNTTKKSIIISSIIFAIVHGSLINILYALILGLILNTIYHKYNNIKSSILIHMSANIISIFLTEFNIYILILSLTGVIISTIIINKSIKN